MIDKICFETFVQDLYLKIVPDLVSKNVPDLFEKHNFNRNDFENCPGCIFKNCPGFSLKVVPELLKKHNFKSCPGFIKNIISIAMICKSLSGSWLSQVRCHHESCCHPPSSISSHVRACGCQDNSKVREMFEFSWIVNSNFDIVFHIIN